MDWRQYIHTDFNVMMGKPVIIGTRIPVELILEKLATQELKNAFAVIGPRSVRIRPRLV
ncbi:MAG: DUF433 domain-containing protein [Anaerolineae bacterium]